MKRTPSTNRKKAGGPSRIDAVEKVTGRAIYADDIRLDRMLHAAPLHAPHPSARIKRVNTERARTLPGVIDVITAKDVPGILQVCGVIPDQYVLASDRTRYSGDVVAVVAAESPAIARRATELIIVDDEPMEPITTPREALEPGALLMHEGRRDNVVTSFRVRHGDMKKGYRQSEKTVEATFNTQFIEHAYMEPESCVAFPEPDGSITVHGGMQHPFSTRRVVAKTLGVPLARVRIVQTTLGGGFGGRDDTIAVICARAALLALRTKRPVKMTYTREESIRESYKRHPFEIHYKAGLGADGQFSAMEVDITADAGPYCSVSPFVIWRPTVQCTGPYIVPNVRCDTKAVYTNNTYTGAMRGFGTPQQVFACESFIDMCAEAAGMDPLAFRQKNFFRQGTTTHTGQKLSGHTVSLEEVTGKALRAIGWKKKFRQCSRGKPNADGMLSGIGFAVSYRGVSLGAEGVDFSSAIVNVQQDGSVLMQSGVSENGQGLKSAMVRILCGELGLDAKRVHFLDTDTSTVPDGGPTVASRGTIMGGNAVIDACRQIKERMRPALKALIGASRKPYLYTNGRIRNSQNGKSVAFEKAAAACFEKQTYLHALGVFQAPTVSWEEARGRGNAYFTYVYGCQACEVEVEAKTGKVRVTNVVAAHEVGRAINPQMAAGQIFGGILMGLGFALKEEIRHQSAVIQNTNLGTYTIPRATDAPEMTAILVENPDPVGPWGAKSLGEPTNELMGAAVANAIYSATGVRLFETPMTPERVKMASVSSSSF